MIKKTTKKACEKCQSLSKEEKEKKINNTVLNDAKIYQKMKSKSTGKNIKWGKMPYDYKKLFSFRKSTIVLKKC